MTDLQIEQFVKYFWRSLHPDLFIKPLALKPSQVDLVIEILGDAFGGLRLRTLGKVYHPGTI